MTACSPRQDSYSDFSETNYDVAALDPILVKCDIDSLPVIIDVEDLYVHDDALLAASEMDTFAFYRFSLDDFSLIDRFGRRGEGPGEFIEPSIFLSRPPRPLYVIDSWRQRMLNASQEGDTIRLEGDLLMNMAKEISWPYIGFYQLGAQGREFCTYDIERGGVVDSICVPNLFPGLKNVPFFWNSNSSKVVLTFCLADAVMTFDVSEGKLKNGVRGRGTGQDGEEAYASVQCLDDCFLVMTNKDALSTGGSKIIVFDYDCNPLQVIQTDRIGRRMAYAPKRHLVLMSGLEDDYIYSFRLHDRQAD